MAKVTVSSPWVSYARKLYMLFGQDEEINILYLNDGPEVKLYVNNGEKAAALEKILPSEKAFGNVTLKITVIPSNAADSPVDIFRKAFTGNPIFEGIIASDDPTNPGLAHFMFANEVVQYFNDSLNDPHGLETTLYEDIANEVFENHEGVFFNTESDGFVEIWP